MGGAGQPRGPYAQAKHEAAEEDGLGTVAVEERLASAQGVEALAVEAAGPLEQPASTLAPDDVADVVADDRRGGGDRR